MNTETDCVTDASIEREIVAKGLTAPRITPADIEANIADEQYFTALDGYAGTQPGTSAEHRHGRINRGPLGLLTFCVLVLQNGFTVTGKSACASPENFDAEIGRKIARADAINQIWPLMGYALKEQLFQAQQPAQAPCESAIPPHQKRVIDEKRELDEKLVKLSDFINASPIFAGLSATEQANLKAQRTAMEAYSCILADRIVGFGVAA